MNLVYEFIVLSSPGLRASVAEWSKAPRSGRGLSGGVGSNPTACTCFKEMSTNFFV